jgi:hypothetical protein
VNAQNSRPANGARAPFSALSPAHTRIPWRALGACAFVCLVAAWLVLVTGCKSAPALSPRPAVVVTNPAPAIAEGAAKDADISREANGIVARPADATFVAASATRILDVLRLSPWAKTEATIKALVEERDAAISAGKADAKTISDLKGQLDKANSRTDQIIRLGLAAAGAVCIGLGILSAVLAAKVAVLFPGLGPRISIGIGALGGGLLFCSFAYGWALRNQSLVMGSFACGCVTVFILYYANRHHAKKP